MKVVKRGRGSNVLCRMNRDSIVNSPLAIIDSKLVDS